MIADKTRFLGGVSKDASKPKKKGIKNKLYRQFLDEGIINIIEEEDIKRVLSGINGKNISEARALVICLYYTGARPNEVLRLKAKDVKKDGRYIIVQIQGSKRGLPRPVYLPYKKEFVKEFYKFASGIFEERFLFWNFRGHYKRKRMTKRGVTERIEIAYKLRYWFSKWFSWLPDKKIPPYFLRHNRFSKLIMKGASTEEVRQLKGGKTIACVEPYVHLSSATAKKIANRMD